MCSSLSVPPAHQNLVFWPSGQVSYPGPGPDAPSLGAGRREERCVASPYFQGQALPWWVESQATRDYLFSWNRW